MTWIAKPSGGYVLGSQESIQIITEIHNMLDRAGYTLQSQAGILGNAYHESGLNPWRWQSDTVNLMYGGYGIFQYTASTSAATDRYIQVCSGLPYYAPNLSTSQVTAGALPTDGICQMNVFITDYLNKWYAGLWRAYWPENAELRAKCNAILSNYGNGSALTQAQFSRIPNIEDATIAFLGCFEGPAIPNYTVRVNTAIEVYDILINLPHHGGGKMPLWMMMKPYWKR